MLVTISHGIVVRTRASSYVTISDPFRATATASRSSID